MTGRRAAPYLLEFTLDKICKASSIRSYAALWKYNATLYGKYVCTYLSLCIGNRLQAVSISTEESARPGQVLRGNRKFEAFSHRRVHTFARLRFTDYTTAQPFLEICGERA